MTVVPAGRIAPAAGAEAGGKPTSWPRVGLLCLVGVTVALQIGKVPGQLPAIAKELGLGLFDSGLIISIFSLLAAAGGIFIGSLAERYGNRRLILAGLVLGGAASFAGSFSGSGWFLLATRIVEGLAFILATTSTPSLITAEANPAERGRALGIWSMYMPAGMSIMMFAAGFIGGAMDWRGLWRLTAALNLVYAAVIWVAFGRRLASPPAPSIVPAVKLASFTTTFAAALRPGPLLLAGCFLTYAGNFLALTGFLPLMLEGAGEASKGAAGLMVAPVVAVNMLGNAASGYIAELGLPRPRIIAVAAAIMGIAAIGVFAGGLPFGWRYGLALLFSIVGGVIPGTCFGSVQSFADSPAKASAIFGGLIQGAGIGQLFGPALVGAVVQAIGSWQGAAIFIAASALINMALALTLARFTPPPRPRGPASSI